MLFLGVDTSFFSAEFIEFRGNLMPERGKQLENVAFEECVNVLVGLMEKYSHLIEEETERIEVLENSTSILFYFML